jgi:phage FluMu gp28-like protein
MLWDVPETLNGEYRDCYVGIDVGRVNDLTDIWVIEQYENEKSTTNYDRFDYKTVCHFSLKNTDFPTQYQIIKPIIAHSSIRGGLIDEGGIGRALADALVAEFPNIMQPVSFTRPWKASAAERLSGYVSAKRISMPKDQFTRKQFLAMKRTANESGTLIYDGRTNSTHCDAFWSCALALQAAEQSQGATVL